MVFLFDSDLLIFGPDNRVCCSLFDLQCVSPLSPVIDCSPHSFICYVERCESGKDNEWESYIDDREHDVNWMYWMNLSVKNWMGLHQRSLCTPNSVPMVFIVFSRHRWPLYRAYIGISHRGALVGVHPTIPWKISWHVRLPMCSKMSGQYRSNNPWACPEP